MAPGGRLPRRRFLWIGAAAGALAAGGCATTARPATTPTPAASATTVHFQIDVLGLKVTKTLTDLIQGFVDQSFNAKHRGVRAVWQPSGNLGAVATAITAGGGQSPVVVSGCCTDWPVILPFLAPLDPFLKKDNLSSSIWDQAQIAVFTAPGGLLAAPSEAVAQAYLYRQDILDNLGLPYPQPDWTSDEAARVWQACTGQVSGQHRYGGTIPFNSSGPFPGVAILHGFGGGLVGPDGTTCLLDQPGSIAAGEYAFNLLWDKVCAPGDGLPVAGIATGQVVFTQGAAVSLFWAVQNLQAAKWDFLPFPRWPTRSAAIVQSNFYGLSAAAPDQEMAWQLFRFAAIDPDLQRFIMRLSYGSPGLPALLPEWETVVRAAAPPLKDKALQYWVDPAAAGDGFSAFEFFKYSPAEALTTLGGTWGKVWNRQMGVAEGFRLLTQQMNAFEKAAASQAAAKSPKAP